MSTTPEVIEQKALSLPNQAQALITITDQRSFDAAARKLRDVVTVRREIESYHEPLKAAAWKAHQTIIAAEKRMLTPVAQAERIIKVAIGQYEQEQLRIQEQERLRLKREAEERAEQERLRLLKEAAANTQREMDRMLEEASTFEEADAILNQTPIAVAGAVEEAKREPMPMIEYQVEPQIYKHPGVSTIPTWRAEVENIRELCRAIADGEPGVSVELVLPNMPALNKLANALKGGMKVPGVRVVQGSSVRARGR